MAFRGELKLKATARLFARAAVVVGVHGGALANIIFCKEDVPWKNSLQHLDGLVRGCFGGLIHDVELVFFLCVWKREFYNRLFEDMLR